MLAVQGLAAIKRELHLGVDQCAEHTHRAHPTDRPRAPEKSLRQPIGTPSGDDNMEKWR